MVDAFEAVSCHSVGSVSALQSTNRFSEQEKTAYYSNIRSVTLGKLDKTSRLPPSDTCTEIVCRVPGLAKRNLIGWVPK
jgi:hypothetical protein